MTVATTPSKGEVLVAIEREREGWEALLAEVGEARMLKPGPMGAWSFKDLIAHLSDWRSHGLDNLEAEADGRPHPAADWPAELQTDDEINDWLHQRSRNRSLAELLEESRESYGRIAALVRRLPEDALSDPAYFPRLDGSALGPVIINGEFFSHLHKEHEADISRWLEAR